MQLFYIHKLHTSFNVLLFHFKSDMIVEEFVNKWYDVHRKLLKIL